MSNGELDSRFAELRQALALAFPSPVAELNGAGAQSAADPAGVPPRLQAAVALVLRATPELDLLLIKRAHSERDPWSGHMALPGGRRDPEDRDLVRTVVRETYEETGIDLDRVGRFLGHLDTLVPASSQLPPLRITPFVVGVPPDTRALPNPAEVDTVVWTPLATFMDPAAARTVLIDVSGGPLSFPSFQVGNEIVWGLTYRIITRFVRSLPGAPGG